jgi:nudix-type nucleoside diphosphatase (YffH/AdpP family)
MPEIRITNETILSDEHYILKRYDFETKNKKGEWTPQQREIFDHGNSATVLLYNPVEKTIILTKQFRMASYVNENPSGMLVETPAGMLEDGEEPEITMLREIKEETGYEVESVQKIYEAYSSAGAFTELIHFYVAPYRKEQKVERGGGLEEEGEEIKVLEMPFAEALRMLEGGGIKDLKTITLLHYAQVKGLL